MSTRSAIGMVNTDGTVDGIYCHWDGGPGWAGRTLATHYTRPDKIRELISNGACSSLGHDIGQQHPFTDWRPDWCTFYRRDRGDKGGLPVHMETADAFYTWARTAGAEFVYLYTGGQWRFLKATNTTARTEVELWDDLREVVNGLTNAAV